MLRIFQQAVNDLKLDMKIMFMLKWDQSWDFFWILKDKVMNAIKNEELESSSDDDSESEWEVTFEEFMTMKKGLVKQPTWKDYTMIGYIGKGLLCTVYLVTHWKSGK